jgi:putative nucleotidyltransferase with HDIG domain
LESKKPINQYDFAPEKHMKQDPAEYLNRISQSILNLPTLPTIAARLLELVDNPRTTAAQIGSLISEDQVLAARLLKMCNSAYYGLDREITSIREAIVLLGFDNVRELSLGVSVINAFGNGKHNHLLDMNSFWDHSAYVGVVARHLAKRFHPELASEAFTAGLLHDIGKVILIQYLGDSFAEILAEARQNERELFSVEREMMGVDHGEVGAWLGKKWKLPPKLLSVMQFHHAPEQAEENQELVVLVNLADLFCRILKSGDGGNPGRPRILPAVRDIAEPIWGFEFSNEAMQHLALELMEEIRNSRNIRGDILE